MAEREPVPPARTDAAATRPVIQGYWTLVWKQYRRNRVAYCSGWVILFLLWLTAWGPLLAHGMPLRWTARDPASGDLMTSYPFFRWLTAPTDGLSVDYLFNYLFFLSLSIPLVFYAARLCRRRKGAADDEPQDGLLAARRRMWRRMALLAVALLLAAIPFVSPGRNVQADGSAGEWRFFRGFRLDQTDYAMGRFDLDRAKGEGALFTLVPFGPNTMSSEIRHPPGRYVRRQGRNYRVMSRDVVKTPHMPNIEYVCFPAVYAGVAGDEVRFEDTGGTLQAAGAAGDPADPAGTRSVPARVLCSDPAVRTELERLSPGARVWVYGAHRPEMDDRGTLTEIRFILSGVAPASEERNGFAHWVGTDKDGRDVLSRMIHGARISMSVGFISVGIGTLLGILIGGLAGYYRGWVDIAISRFMELVICFPTFFLIITIIAFVKERSIFHVMLIMGLTGWTGVARLVRGEFLKLAEQDFVHSARALGCSRTRIMFRHILPNALGPVLVSLAFGIAGAVLTESGLAFLGFGAPAPTPTWGELIKQGHSYVFEGAWWLFLFPGFLIFLTVTVYNLAGDGFRDAMDPRLRK